MKNQSEVDFDLDARGLACPLPLLKMKMVLKDLKANDKLRVLTTDDGSVQDFKSFCELSENTLISFTAKPAYFEFVIKKG